MKQNIFCIGAILILLLGVSELIAEHVEKQKGADELTAEQMRKQEIRAHNKKLVKVLASTASAFVVPLLSSYFLYYQFDSHLIARLEMDKSWKNDAVRLLGACIGSGVGWIITKLWPNTEHKGKATLSGALFLPAIMVVIMDKPWNQ